MNNDEFRRNAHEIVDWIADYFEGLPKQQVIPDVTPGQIRRMLPKSKMGHNIISKLKVYRGNEHPHQAQQPKELKLA